MYIYMYIYYIYIYIFFFFSKSTGTIELRNKDYPITECTSIIVRSHILLVLITVLTAYCSSQALHSFK